jgi:hypothetical protein
VWTGIGAVGTVALGIMLFQEPATVARLVCVALIVAGLVLRDRIASWFEGSRPALAGLVGAIAATIVGTIANDSGALLLTIGTGFAALFIALAWAVDAVTID